MLHKALIGIIGLCLGGLPPAQANAAPAAGAKPVARANLNLPELKRALESGDVDRALSALDEIAQAGSPSAAPLVEAVLNRGASSKLLLRAIAVAGSLGRESSSAALAPYVKHRSAEVRHAAAVSLTHTKGKIAVQALRDALRGSDASLRGAAADGLGSLNAKEAVSDLFVVLPREVPEAAGAIGALCNGEECKRFLNFLGKLPFDVMQSGFLPILLRTDAEAPEHVKLDLIERLRRMATPKTNEVLSTALATYPAGGSPKVKTALDAALHGHSVKADEP
ncbi:MAG: HEAT repeat domain-containing protein [Pseudomonadota bacterium]